MILALLALVLGCLPPVHAAAPSGPADVAAQQDLARGLVALQRSGLVESTAPLQNAFDQAATLLADALTEVRAGPDDPETELDPAAAAATLEDLCRLLVNEGPRDLPARVALLEAAAALRARDRGSRDRRLAQTLGWLGLAQLEADGPEAAEPTLLQALAILEPEGGERLASVVRYLGMLREIQGDHLAARGLYARGVHILEEALGPDDVRLATPLAAIGAVYDRVGHPEAALAAHARALQILTDQLGPDHRRTQEQTRSVARALLILGRTDEALEVYSAALAHQEEVLGPDHPDLAPFLRGLARPLRDLGDLVTARAMLERAVALEEARDPTSAGTASALVDLGLVSRAAGDPDAAASRIERAISLLEARYGPTHVRLTMPLTNLGSVRTTQGDLEGAREPLERALAIRQGYGTEGAALASSLHQLARLNRLAGRLDEALQQHQRALEIRERTLGDRHPDVALSHVGLALVYEALGEPDAMVRHVAMSHAIREGHLDFIDVLSERQALAFLAGVRVSLDDWLMTFTDPAHDAEAWAHVMRWKGAVARRVLARAAQASTDGPTPQAAALDETRRALAAWTLAPPSEDPELRVARIQELTATQDRLEQALGRAAGSLGEAADAVAPSDLCAALPPGAAVVDVLRTQVDAVPTYLAFVLSSDGCRLARVDLGKAAPIEEAAAGWRAALASPDTSRARIDGRGRRLTERVWEPLAAVLGDADPVLVVPDGALSVVPFGALPLDGDRYLLEARLITYLDHPADVLRFAAEPPPAAGALVVGDLTYGPPIPPSPSRTSTCVERAFAPLPGSRAEVEALSRLWRRRRSGAPLTVLTGDEATAAQLAAALPRRELTHLATHGFFVGEDCLANRGDTDGAADIPIDPMTLSGLALSGANVATGTDDGLLTARELAALPFAGTRLVVLSACETGLGLIHAGDGVLGLRRALVAAGTRSVVMSLWSIEDSATAQLMGTFYRHLLARRSPGPAAALRRSQLAQLEAQRRSGLVRPQAWGAFVLAGDWR